MQMREQQVTENQEMLEQLDQEMSLARIQRERRLRHLAQEQVIVQPSACMALSHFALVTA